MYIKLSKLFNTHHTARSPRHRDRDTSSSASPPDPASILDEFRSSRSLALILASLCVRLVSNIHIHYNFFLCGGGTPPKKYPKGPPFGNFGKFFQSSKKSPKIKKSQGSPLWIFWEIFINLKKISNNGLLLKKNKILFSIL